MSGFWDGYQDEEFAPLTKGTYCGLLDNATLDADKTDKDGNPMPELKLRWHIEGSSFDGRKVFQSVFFKEKTAWKVKKVLSRLDTLPDVEPGVSWSQVAHEAAKLVFEKVGNQRALLNVGTRDYNGKTYNDVEIGKLVGDNDPSPLDEDEEIPF